MSNEDFVVISDISFQFGEQLILNHVELSLKKGKSYALIGKSGAGKSTLLNLIAGFIQPSQGRVTIGGGPIKKSKGNTAFLFQDLGLFPWQTVMEAIMMPLLLKKEKNREKAKEQILVLLKEMELESLKDKYPHELSGGQRQRVAIARALISKPELLLMDEPTSSLDSMTKEHIQQLILAQQQKLRTTLLFVSHDIEEAVFLGEVILILNKNGTIQEMKNPYFAQKDAKEQLGFYEACIEIRKSMNMELPMK
ncbi:ABC transporter ATP-binding protein [Niallia endozanthoxylica]|uniref:ABC transporter ATP-binding protein n=1 Tax=Niallia endozanthoxylica TaxID=2036016 RepID=A0A5J5H8H0_9BACI|nr:ABC transporter ATP-binding protein [Niallia endozanthoxylica]KAA9016949.1 ABC transporter ATP-binding protein [Niallia endozanthoxylica]